MKITLTPETDDEREALEIPTTLELHDVREFLLLGVRVKDLVNLDHFHQWYGTHQYLIGQLHFQLMRLEFESTHPKKPKKVGGADEGS